MEKDIQKLRKCYFDIGNLTRDENSPIIYDLNSQQEDFYLLGDLYCQ